MSEDIDAAEPHDRSSKAWLDLITHAEKKFNEYNSKADSIDKLYSDLEQLAKEGDEREFQIFWANLEVLKPSIYSRPPQPVVVPKFKDRKPLPRKASEILERSLVSSFENEDIHETMKLIRDDLAINARGVAWLRYEAQGYEGNLTEKVCYDHVDRKDFLHSIARNWKEVDWVARRTWKTRKEGLERFEQSSGDLWIHAEFKAREDTNKPGGEAIEGEEKAAVWELWHKSANIVVWVSQGLDEVLDITEPFLSLHGFFPCPKPAYGTIQRTSLIPVPDFVYYKDQIEEINELTARISALAEGLRLKGFYASGNGELSDAIEAAIKNTTNNAILIPVSNFAALGGASLKDSIIWLPVDMVAETVKGLVELRRVIMDDVYQITGLSDIMRGASDPNETLGAQELKSQYGSVRVRDRQEELVRIARDMARIAGEIMAENFTPETLLAMSQVDDLPTAENIQQQIQEIVAKAEQAAQSPQAQQMAQQNPEQAQQLLQQAQAAIAELQEEVTIEKVIELYRSQKLRPFVLEIETDSTIQPDENAEKERRGEFLQVMSGVLAQLGPLVQAQPEAAPFAGEILKFALAPFRAGRELEGVIEDFVEKTKEKANQPPPPSPEQIKAEGEQKKSEADMQAKQMDAQIKQQEMAAQMEMEREKHALQMQVIQANLQIKQIELQIKEREGVMKLEMQSASNDIKLSAQEESAKIKAEQMKAKPKAEAA